MKHALLTALLAGIAAALLLTLLQQISTTPRILQAEIYEQTQALVAHEHDEHHGHDATVDHGAHHHDSAAWKPGDGWQRTLATASANLLLACGFGLLLATGFLWRAPLQHWHGLAWGAAGYLTFYLAPSLGLPPELPGTAAAALDYRQAWWLLTVLATASGLAIAVFTDGRWKLAGAVLMVVPHLIGAPQPEQHHSLVPDALLTRFLIDTAWVNGVFWLALGWLSATLYQRLGQPDRPPAPAGAVS